VRRRVRVICPPTPRTHAAWALADLDLAALMKARERCFVTDMVFTITSA
jgi:hypothetical protein